MKKRVYLLILLGGVLLLVQACGAGATLAPASSEKTAPAVFPTQAEAAPTHSPAEAQPTSSAEEPTTVPVPQTQAPAILEERRLNLEWPSVIRSGDSDVVRMTIEVDQQGNLTPTAEIAGHQVRGQTIEIPDVYATHNVLAMARLDMAGVQIAPADMVAQPLLKGRSATFYWSVNPPGVNTYRGTVWLYLRFVPLDGSAPSERAISAQMIEIRSVNFLGLGSTPARFLGIGGTLLGSVLSLDSLVSFLIKQFGKKRGGKKDSED